MASSRPARLARDTTRAIEARQIAAWRALSTVEIARLVTGASNAVRTLALAGLQSRYPGAGKPELVARLARMTLGDDLARRVYPELGRLDP